MFASAAYRISFTFAAAFALAVLLLGVAVYFAADAEFGAQRDRDISEQVQELLQKHNRAKMRDEIVEREQQIASQPFGYALFDRHNRRQIAGSLRLTRMPAPGFGWVAFIDPKEGMDRARARTVDLDFGDRLTVGVDSEQVEVIDAIILGLFGVAFLVVIAISVGGGILLARYLQHRLDRIGGTAQSIVAGDFSKRVPLTDSDDEFEQAGRAVNIMLDRIEQLMGNLRQVSSDLAHDLRTPLLRLRAQLDRVPTEPAAAGSAIEEADKLLELFNAILRINEVEGGALSTSFAAIDMSALVADLGESYQIALAEDGRSLSCTVEQGVSVRGHAELLSQSITNLLDNCRVHTPPGTRIELRLATTSGEAVVSVADNGPGLSLDDRTRVLGRFVRGDGSRSTPGSGLGLSLVAAVAKAHRGTVTLLDAEPGLLVRISLPAISGPD